MKQNSVGQVILWEAEYQGLGFCRPWDKSDQSLFIYRWFLKMEHSYAIFFTCSLHLFSCHNSSSKNSCAPHSDILVNDGPYIWWCCRRVLPSDMIAVLVYVSILLMLTKQWNGIVTFSIMMIPTFKPCTMIITTNTICLTMLRAFLVCSSTEKIVNS